jgi:hypothetical protein
VNDRVPDITKVVKKTGGGSEDEIEVPMWQGDDDKGDDDGSCGAGDLELADRNETMSKLHQK